MELPIERNETPKLFLVRHGATDWTDSRQHTGLTDIPLNSKGELAAVQLRNRLGLERLDMVFTSPLVRAKRTCELTGYLAKAQVHLDLVEWNYGSYEGLTTREIQKERPGWNLFRDGAPLGESPGQVMIRAERFIELVRRHDCNVAAFSSGHISRMIAACWLKLPPEAAGCFHLSTASVSVLGYEHNRNEPNILLWNEVQKPNQ